MTKNEIKKILANTPRNENIYIMFKKDKIPKYQWNMYCTPIKCFWTVDNGWSFASLWSYKTSSYPLNIEMINKIITKEESPEYFL